MPATQRVDQKERTAIVPMDALRGFFHIMDAWGVSADDARVLLGSPAERTYYAWRQGNGVRVPMDTLRRVGYIAGIYKALQIVYSDAHLADGWVKCAGRPARSRWPVHTSEGVANRVPADASPPASRPTAHGSRPALNRREGT